MGKRQYSWLLIRDNKKKYLELIPYGWQMINYRMNQNKIFDNLKLLLKNNFSEFLVKWYEN